MQPFVLGFVGAHDNGILRWWTQRILSGLGDRGYRHALVDLADPGWRDGLSDVLAGGMPQFAFSFQGFAADVRMGTENFWSRSGVPFLTYLGDAPYHSPGMHAAEGPGLYLLYGCEDFLETYRDLMHGRAYASVLPYGYPDNPHAADTPWARRTHPAVFVKSGIDPSELRGQWARYPAPTRAIIEDASALALTGADRTIAELCADSFAARAIHWGERRELFLFVASTVDRYVRAVRADRMVRALLPHPVTIIGDWSHLEGLERRARIARPVPADTLDALYADTQVVVNTSPSVRRGMHERIMAGLLARAAVLSDTTPYLDRTLAPAPAFLGLDIDAPGFGEAVAETLAAALADPAMPDKTQASHRFAQRAFGFEPFLDRLLAHVGIERHRRELGFFSFPPQPSPMPEAA